MKDPSMYLDHILESIAAIETYTDQLTFAAFVSNGQAQDAVIRRLEIIGEAARHLSDHMLRQTSHIEWRAVKAMRNFLIHEYFNVDVRLVWKVVKNDLPVMKLALQDLKNTNYVVGKN